VVSFKRTSGILCGRHDHPTAVAMSFDVRMSPEPPDPGGIVSHVVLSHILQLSDSLPGVQARTGESRPFNASGQSFRIEDADGDDDASMDDGNRFKICLI